MCQSAAAWSRNSPARTAVARAIVPSATIITRRRFQRSTRAPATGPSTICGSSPISEAAASAVAEPVDWVTYQIRANCTRLLPNSENACPVQTTKNGRMEDGRGRAVDCMTDSL